jgi:hypothetical protein
MRNPMNKFKIALVSTTLALSMLPSVGWSTRAFAPAVAGQITALPGGDRIEVSGKTYHVKSGSAAEQALGKLSTGQQVQLTFDGAPGSPQAEVIAISTTSETEG